MIGGGPQKITVEIGGKVAASLAASLKGAQQQVSTFGRNVSRTMNDAAIAGRRSFKGMFDSALWQQATVGATAFAGAIGLSVRAAMQFDNAMADVRKAIDFKDGAAGVRRFGNELVRLSGELPYTAAELSKIAASAGFAGYAESEIIPFTRAAARMGIAFQMTAEQAGDAMVAMRAAMGLTQPQVEKLGDAINYLSDRFQGTVNAADLTEVTRRVGAIGKAAGLTAEQVAGMGAAFLASGTPTEVAATGLKNFLNALTKGEQATANQQYALATLFRGGDLAAQIKTGKGKAKAAAKGVAADISEELAKGMQIDPEATIKSVLEKMAKLPKEQQVSIAGALFGEESKAAIMPLLTNTKLIGQAFDLIRKESAFAGSMQKEFQNQMATSGAQAKIFQNGLNALGISIGSALLPSLNGIMKAIGPIMVGFAGWAQNNQGLVTGIVLIGGALAGLIIVLPIIAGVISAIGTIGTAWAGFQALNIAGWIAGALIPAIAGIGTAIAGFVSSAVAGFGAFAAAAFTAMLPLLPWIALIAGIGAAIYGLIRYWPQISAAAATAWAGVQSAAATAWGSIVAQWGRFSQWVGEVWTAGMNIIRAWGPKVLAVMFPLPALIVTVFRRLLPGVQGVFNQLVAFIRETPGKVADVGQRVIEAILNGLKSKAGALFGWIGNTWDRIKSMVTAAPSTPAPATGGARSARPTPPVRRSMGGRVKAGLPYIVGELRRELFVPGMDGAIIPRVAQPLAAAGLSALMVLQSPAPAPAAPARRVPAPLPATAPAPRPTAPVTINAPITINAGSGDAMEIRRQVQLAFIDIQHEIESSHRVLLND